MPQLVRDMASEILVPQNHLVDLQELFKFDKIADYYSDYVHLNDKGYQKVAEKLFEVVF